MSKPGPTDQELLASIKMDFDLLLLAPDALFKGIKEAQNLNELEEEIKKFREKINKENQGLPQAFSQDANKLTNERLKMLLERRHNDLLNAMSQVISNDEFDPVAALNTASTTAATVQAGQNTQAPPDNPSEGQYTVMPRFDSSPAREDNIYEVMPRFDSSPAREDNIYEVMPSVDEPPRVQPIKVRFEDENGKTISAKRQAEQIIQRFQKEIDAGNNVAITYSANSKQADDIYKGYETGDFSIRGSNQAQVIKLVIEAIHKNGWEDKAHILPVATMSYNKKHKIESVSRETVERDLGNIAQHVGAGWTVLGFQNQDSKPDELAVGGAISKGVWDDQKENKQLFDQGMKKMLAGEYSDFKESIEKGKQGVPKTDPSVAPVSKHTRAKTAVKGAVKGALASMREKMSRHSEQAPIAAPSELNVSPTSQAQPKAAQSTSPTMAAPLIDPSARKPRDYMVELPKFPPRAAATETAAAQPSIVPPPTEAQRAGLVKPQGPPPAPPPSAPQVAGLVKPQGPPPTPSSGRVLQGEIQLKWTLQGDVYRSPPMSSGDLNKLVEKGLKNFEFESVGNTDKFIAKAPASMVAELTQPTAAAVNPALGELRKPALDLQRQHAAASSSGITSKPSDVTVQPTNDPEKNRKSGPSQ